MSYSLTNQPITRGVSLVSTVRNRATNLIQVIDSWLASPNVNEIIIIDWGSSPSTVELFKQRNSEKIIHVYVTGQEYYCHTRASNLGASFATKDKLLFLDADIILHQEFFNQCKLSKNIFYAGNWRLARDSNEVYLNGQFFVNRDDFFAINGLDERIQNYGWDDSDLYRRLTAPKATLYINIPAKVFWNFPPVFGVKRKDIPPETLSHLPHTDVERVAEYENKNSPPVKQIQDNRKLSIHRKPWSKKFKLKQYDFSQTSPGFFKARQLEDSFFAVKPLNGLGNRLRVIASCWVASEVLEKKLYLCWSPSSGFSRESFESLLSIKLDFISEEAYRALERNPNNVAIDKRVQTDTIYSDPESGGYRDIVFWTNGINKNNLLLEWHNSLDHLSRGQLLQNPAFRDFNVLFAEKLKLLTPADRIKQAVVAFADNNFKQQKVIGFHLRRGDALQSPWVKEYEVSSDTLFIKKMQQELEQDSKVKFFISTDCEDTFEKIRALYPGQIIFYQKKFVESKFQAPKDNQADAFIEMLLLSKTTRIIGSRWSTFSEMAAKIGGVELEICE